MKFTVTPEEAQRAATAVAKYLAKHKMSVKIESAVRSDAPYRTTLLAAKSGLQVLVEAQGTPNYDRPLRELAVWLAANRIYAEFYLATMSDASLQAGVLGEMDRDGVGLFVVNEELAVSVSREAKNPALIVTPDPTLKFGDCRGEVLAAVKEFNEGDRKDGLRDICEIVERETERIAVSAARKGWLCTGIDGGRISQMNWENQINMLSSSNSYNAGRSPILHHDLKDDLRSFKGARHLVDHKVMNKRDEAKRQRQYAERMMMGPRLVAELVSLKRKIK